MHLGLHNVSNAACPDLALRQESGNAEEIRAFTRPCRYCGRAEAAYKQHYCGDVCRFWSKVRKGPECWEWQASKFGGRKGKTYGQFTIYRDGQQVHVGAHQFVYWLTHGRYVPEGLEIRHKCHNPICVRPEHITTGTHTQNVRDASEAGHLHVARPSNQKLTAEQIADIVAFVTAHGRGGASRMAEQYHISRSYVGMLVRGLRRQYDAPLRPELKQVG